MITTKRRKKSRKRTIVRKRKESGEGLEEGRRKVRRSKNLTGKGEEKEEEGQLERI